MTDDDDIKASLADIKSTLATISDSQADHQARLVELERVRHEMPSRADVGAGDMQNARDLALLEVRLGQKVDACAMALSSASESRGGDVQALFLALGILVVSGGLVARGILPAAEFVGTVTGLGAAFSGWLHFKRKRRAMALTGSLHPSKGP